MTDKNISEEVKKFIHKYIDSLAKLEVLLLLHNNPSDLFSAQMIAQEMRTNHDAVLATLKELQADNFITLENPENQFYQYNRGNKDDMWIRQVDSAYTNYRHSIITIIFSKPSDSIRSFADAFKLKKDDNNG